MYIFDLKKNQEGREVFKYFEVFNYCWQKLYMCMYGTIVTVQRKR